MADELNGVKTEAQAAQAPKLRSGRFLNRLDSAILYGIAGAVLGGVSVSLGFLPATVGTVATGAAVGVSMFAAEWIRGIVE